MNKLSLSRGVRISWLVLSIDYFIRCVPAKMKHCGAKACGCTNLRAATRFNRSLYTPSVMQHPRHVNISFVFQNWSRMAVRHTKLVRRGAVKHGKYSDDATSLELWGTSHPGSRAYSRDDPIAASIVLRPLRQRRPTTGRESQFFLHSQKLWER